MLATRAPSWWPLAACRGFPTSLFYPERGDRIAVADARRVCAGCAVRGACLDHALQHERSPRFGIIGGTSARQRNLLARGGRPTTAVLPMGNTPTTAVEPVVVRMRRTYAAAL